MSHGSRMSGLQHKMITSHISTTHTNEWIATHHDNITHINDYATHINGCFKFTCVGLFVYHGGFVQTHLDFVGLSCYFRESLESLRDFTFVHLFIFASVSFDTFTCSGEWRGPRCAGNVWNQQIATPFYVCNDTFICMIWLIHVCDICPAYTTTRQKKKCKDTPKNESWNAYEWVMSHVWMIPGIYLK